MDIHKPKPWHGVRELAKEIGTIVIGVLIALAGEQVVERFHRAEQARLAERAMRLELGDDDGPQAFARVVIGRCLDNRLAQIHDGAASAPVAQLRAWAAAYVPPVRSWDSEAWKVVAASDVGAFMGAERLVDWSAPYRMLPLMNDNNHREAELAAELREALPPSGEPSAAERQNLRRLAGLLRFQNASIERGSELFLVRIKKLGAPVSIRTQQTLVGQARTLYGDCAAAPDVDAPAPAQNPTANLRGFAGWPVSGGPAANGADRP